jgi:hypothetical protein
MILELNRFDVPFLFLFLLKGLWESKHEEEEKIWSHYVTLFDTFTIWDVTDFIAYLEFEDKVIMESFDEIYGIVQGAIYFKKFVQKIMVCCCIEGFTKVYEKCPGTQIVVPP